MKKRFFLNLFFISISLFILFLFSVKSNKNTKEINITPDSLKIVSNKIDSIKQPIVEKKVIKMLPKKIIAKDTIQKKKEEIELFKMTNSDTVPNISSQKDVIEKTDNKATPLSKKEIVQDSSIIIDKKTIDISQIKQDYIREISTKIFNSVKYPKIALKTKLEGKIVILFTINRDGSFSNIKIAKKCQHKILNNDALKLIKSLSRYKAIPQEIPENHFDIKLPIIYKHTRVY